MKTRIIVLASLVVFTTFFSCSIDERFALDRLELDQAHEIIGQYNKTKTSLEPSQVVLGTFSIKGVSIDELEATIEPDGSDESQTFTLQLSDAQTIVEDRILLDSKILILDNFLVVLTDEDSGNLLFKLDSEAYLDALKGVEFTTIYEGIAWL